MLIDIYRDKQSEDEILRNVTTFTVTKNRPFARLGEAGAVLWDEGTTTLTEWIND